MTRARVKICCIRDEAEVAMAVGAGADVLGFVGEMPTGPGPIPDATIARLTPLVPPGVGAFVLTAETTAAGIAAQAARTGASVVQIVDHIPAGEHPALSALAPHLKRVQVIHVEGPEALALIGPYEPHVDAFLLDSGRLAARELGGTGRTHDWAVSRAFVAATRRPVFLAGGLNPGNIGEAIRVVRPFGVDLCTGVRSDGRLDAAKLSAFMGAVAAASGGA